MTVAGLHHVNPPETGKHIHFTGGADRHGHCLCVGMGAEKQLGDQGEEPVAGDGYPFLVDDRHLLAADIDDVRPP